MWKGLDSIVRNDSISINLSIGFLKSIFSNPVQIILINPARIRILTGVSSPRISTFPRLNAARRMGTKAYRRGMISCATVRAATIVAKIGLKSNEIRLLLIYGESRR